MNFATARGSIWVSSFCALAVLGVATLARAQVEPSESSSPKSGRTSWISALFRSPLQRAIRRGMKPGGNLSDELYELGDYAVHSRKDAEAICDALRQLPSPQAQQTNLFSSRLAALTRMFSDVDGRDAPAFEVLSSEGVSELIRIYKATVEHANEEQVDELLYVLKILALYETRAGAETVVEAARRPLAPDDYMWQVILSQFAYAHPHREYVFEALSDPLPPQFMAIALLDSANVAAAEDDFRPHPFDSPAGWARLEGWLTGGDPEHFSYAHSATAALPFMANPARDRLLALAMDHTDADVQMEAARVAARLGRKTGFERLVRSCLDVNYSETAQQYLIELEREDLIPAAAKEPDFQALSTFANWLAHPHELGQAPDEIEIVDHRVLDWPPERDPKPFWLIRYRLRDRTGLADDDVDCGLVGSMTWCFFSEMNERPPEDVYAIHCYWEMQQAELINENEVIDTGQYSGLLEQWPGRLLESPRIRHVAEVSPELKLPAAQVALASAKLDGADGWVVLDGPRSTWYPRDEQPPDTHETTLLSIHVGRQLLGFTEPPDRKKYLITERPRREPRQIVAAYEKLIAEAAHAEPEKQAELLGSWGTLTEHFDAYVDALAAVKGTPRPEVVIAVYERFLRLAKEADPSIRGEVFGCVGVLGSPQFENYTDALFATGRSEDVVASIELFAPHWDHNLGYGLLGTAAYKAERRDLAEPYFVKLRQGLEDFQRCEEMSLLAEIWNKRGDVEQARDLLADCMRRLVNEIRESEYNSERDRHAEQFQHHRAAYLRLFPDGENELAKLGIPVDPL